uniref:Platelet-derived growth factor receptor-like protein n=1 Tax=Daphnia galeata TaxID=27404 RepID=A0A8J2RV58_9CRUS|nr:unnamed protein product [Daphnia galeata]
MLSTNSTRWAIVLILTFTLMANEIVSTDDIVTYSFHNLFSEADPYKQKVIEQGSTLTLTCLEKLESYKSTDKFRWEGPNEGTQKRLNVTNFRTETHLISTLTLENPTIYDTGYYRCDGRLSDLRYIYISSQENLFFMDAGGAGVKIERSKIISQPGDSIAIPLKVTHPDVRISVYRQTREIGRGEPQKEFSKVFDSTSQIENSRWSFAPRVGLTLKNTTIFDSTYYYFVGYIDNNKSFVVNIKHDKEMTEFLNWILPLDKVNVTDVKKFLLVIKGIELELKGSPSNPVEGSNVTLICSTSNDSNDLPFMPTWKYHGIRGRTQQAYSNRGPPEIYRFPEGTQSFLEQPNKDIQIKTERKWSDVHFYKSRLTLHNVSLDTNYTTFGCGFDRELSSQFKKISFTIEEINNEPMNNVITLNKRVAQNLTCYRLTQFVPVQWLKVNSYFFSQKYLFIL